MTLFETRPSVVIYEFFFFCGERVPTFVNRSKSNEKLSGYLIIVNKSEGRVESGILITITKTIV